MSHPRSRDIDWGTEQTTDSDTSGARVVSSPSKPMPVARDLAQALYTDSDGRVLLRDHRGDFYRWNGTCWREIDKRDVRGAAYGWLEHASYCHEKNGVVPFDPSRRKIDDVIDALRAVVLLDSSAEAPCWTGSTTDPPANELISMTNGTPPHSDADLAGAHPQFLLPPRIDVSVFRRVRTASALARVPARAVG